MAQPDFALGEGDKGPILEETLFQSGTTTPMDLTGATATIRFVPRNRSLPAFVESVSIAGAPTDGNVMWIPQGTYPPGFYDYQWIVLFPGPTQMTWPTDPERKYKLLEVIAKLV